MLLERSPLSPVYLTRNRKITGIIVGDKGCHLKSPLRIFPEHRPLPVSQMTYVFRKEGYGEKKMKINKQSLILSALTVVVTPVLAIASCDLPDQSHEMDRQVHTMDEEQGTDYKHLAQTTFDQQIKPVEWGNIEESDDDIDSAMNGVIDPEDFKLEDGSYDMAEMMEAMYREKLALPIKFKNLLEEDGPENTCINLTNPSFEGVAANGCIYGVHYVPNPGKNTGGKNYYYRCCGGECTNYKVCGVDSNGFEACGG